jgi:hypothetical protein
MQIEFVLTRTKRLSLGIYSRVGKLVRQLLNAETRGVGTHTVEWDGSIDGDPADPNNFGPFYWRLLEMPEPGIRAEYLTVIGTNLPAGQNWWETGLGNHVGPRAVAVDETGVYLGAGNSELVRNALKMDRNGQQCLWSAGYPARPKDAQDNLGHHLGRWALALLKDVPYERAGVRGLERRLYHLQQDGWIGWHPADEVPNPNWPPANEPRNVLETIVTVREKESADERRGWDALWPGDARPTPDDWRGYQSPVKDMDEVATGTDYEMVRELPMDMAAGFLKAPWREGPVIVVSYRDHNAVKIYAPDGMTLATVFVTKPLGVAIDQQGQVLVISQRKVVRLEWRIGCMAIPFLPNILTILRIEPVIYYEAEPVMIIQHSELRSPYRLDVDRSDGPTHGHILVAESSTSHQVWRFLSDGTLISIYGKPEGRPYDEKWEDVKNLFLNIVDICTDPTDGGFWIVEGSAPRRVARFHQDGTLAAEWYGGTFWVPFASPNPAPTNPQERADVDVWLTSTPFELVRWTLSQEFDSDRPTTFSATIRSVHRFDNLVYRGPVGPFNVRLIGRCHGNGGGGDLDWHVRSGPSNIASAARHTYLVRRGRVQVIQVKEATADGSGGASLRVVTAARLNRSIKRGVKVITTERGATIEPVLTREDAPMGEPPYPPDVFVSTVFNDANTFRIYEPETNKKGIADNHLQSLQTTSGFNYYHLALEADGPTDPDLNIKNGQVMLLEVASWNEAGAPVYDLSIPEPVPDPDTRAWRPLATMPKLPPKSPQNQSPDYKDNQNGGYWQKLQGMFAQADFDDAPLYALVNADKQNEDTANFNHLYKLVRDDPRWRVQWELGKHEERPSQRQQPPPLPPGHIYSFRNAIGVVRRAESALEINNQDGRETQIDVEVVIATDFNGGYDGAGPAITYAWDSYGLYVGNPFEQHDTTTGVPEWRYNHSSDNACGSICDERDMNGSKTGNVLYFAGAENEVRVYRITGWKDWRYQIGSVLTDTEP